MNFPVLPAPLRENMFSAAPVIVLSRSVHIHDTTGTDTAARRIDRPGRRAPTNHCIIEGVMT